MQVWGSAYHNADNRHVYAVVVGLECTGALAGHLGSAISRDPRAWMLRSKAHFLSVHWVGHLRHVQRRRQIHFAWGGQDGDKWHQGGRVRPEIRNGGMAVVGMCHQQLLNSCGPSPASPGDRNREGGRAPQGQESGSANAILLHLVLLGKWSGLGWGQRSEAVTKGQNYRYGENRARHYIRTDVPCTNQSNQR